MPLPPVAAQLLLTIDMAIVTHHRLGHVDHLDRPGRDLLAQRKVPVYTASDDCPSLTSQGLEARPVDGNGTTIGSVTVRTIAARHGHGWIGRCMGKGAGYVLRAPGEPTLYLSGDTVLIDETRSVLQNDRPDVTVVHAGGACLDVGRPLLMDLDEIVELARLAPGRIVATHLEALDHCPVTRDALRERCIAEGISERVLIPRDGDSLLFHCAAQRAF